MEKSFEDELRKRENIAIERYLGRKWSHLEFEEQCHIRCLLRERKVTIEGTGCNRRVVRYHRVAAAP